MGGKRLTTLLLLMLALLVVLYVVRVGCKGQDEKTAGIYDGYSKEQLDHIKKMNPLLPEDWMKPGTAKNAGGPGGAGRPGGPGGAGRPGGPGGPGGGNAPQAATPQAGVSQTTGSSQQAAPQTPAP